MDLCPFILDLPLDDVCTGVFEVDDGCIGGFDVDLFDIESFGVKSLEIDNLLEFIADLIGIEDCNNDEGVPEFFLMELMIDLTLCCSFKLDGLSVLTVFTFAVTKKEFSSLFIE